jgi:hypothetical protein
MSKPFTALPVLIAAASTGLLAAQTLQITAPATGTVVHPGDTISVTVNSSDAEFNKVFLVGSDPLGIVIAPPQSHLPAEFRVDIPRKSYSQTSTITALGLTDDGKHVYSEPIRIDIERADLPVKLRAEMSFVDFDCPSDIPLPILLTAFFQDGSAALIERSSKLSYSSANPTVAEADSQGLLYARSPGKTIVTATYGEDNQRIQLAIPVTVEVGPLAASTYALSFGDQPVGTSNSKKVVLKSRTLGQLSVRVHISPNFSETDNCFSSSPLPRQGTCTVNVTFSPSKIGPQKGSLTIMNDFSSGQLAISLDGMGTGQ